jgi:hypothetical protein
MIEHSLHGSVEHERGRRPLFRAWLSAVWFSAAMTGAFAAEPTIPGACAERDLQALTIIEERANAQAAPPERLFEAYLAVMDARHACATGDLRTALRLYDDIQSRTRTAERAQPIR